MNIVAECEKCKSKFSVGNEGTCAPSYNSEFDVNGQSIFITYYDCPQCGKRHFVQVDCKETLQELERAKIMLRKQMALKAKGKTSEKQSAEFKKARQDLAIHRTNLMKEFTGKTAVEKETGKSFVLRFSV